MSTENQEKNNEMWDAWKGWGTGITCGKCNEGELRVDENDIWCNNQKCQRQGNIVWDDDDKKETGIN